jgi:uncharacterized protein
MEVIDFLGRGWKFPVMVEGGKIACSEAEECIKDSIRIILGTAKGERMMRPEFGCGINELVFAPNTTTTATLAGYHIREALLEWEPRIEVLDVQVTPDNDDRYKLNINIEYRVKTINSKYNLVYPFYLEKAGK